MTTKTCNKCHKTKELSEFYRAARMGDGLTGECRECLCRYNRNRYGTISKERDRRLALRRVNYAKNRERELERGRRHKKEHPNVSRAWRLKNYFNMTLEEHNKLYECQNGRCAICNDAMPQFGGKGGGMHIDHRHNNGEVFGLLCPMCNKSLGGFGDSPENLRKAASYLEDPPARRILGRRVLGRKGKVGH